MQVLPISSKPADSDEVLPERPRSRLRRFARPDRLFLIVVVVPVVAAIIYFGFLASDVYESPAGVDQLLFGTLIGLTFGGEAAQGAARASSGVLTCGTMIPWIPASSTRLM